VGEDRGMKLRSRIHMLMVAAARLEADRASPELVADLRKAAKQVSEASADGRGCGHEDAKRIERQRTLFAMLPDCRATDALRAAMLQRAYDLMWDGDGLACDALAEFLPSKEVERMFDAWENDQNSNLERSQFYSGKAA
jgi:hypothetical protein